jgi:hypothetical protein
MGGGRRQRQGGNNSFFFQPIFPSQYTQTGKTCPECPNRPVPSFACPQFGIVSEWKAPRSTTGADLAVCVAVVAKKQTVSVCVQVALAAMLLVPPESKEKGVCPFFRLGHRKTVALFWGCLWVGRRHRTGDTGRRQDCRLVLGLLVGGRGHRTGDAGHRQDCRPFGAIRGRE